MRHSVACVLAVVVVFACLPLASNAQGQTSGPFEITAGQWHKTGVMLEKGQSFQVEALGLVHSTNDAKNEWGAGGYYHLGFRAFSAKAKVGTEFFEVGSDGMLATQTKEGGEVLLGLSYTYDPKPEEANSVAGSFSMKVIVGARRPEGSGGDSEGDCWLGFRGHPVPGRNRRVAADVGRARASTGCGDCHGLGRIAHAQH